MKAPLAVLFAAALSACASVPEGPVQGAIDAIVADDVASGAFAGVVLVGDAEGILHAKAYGTRGEGGPPHALDPEWRWASVTKMLAAWLALQEVEAGSLSLDGDLSRLLPDRPEHVRRLTLRQLLSHTSGLPNPANLPDDGERLWNLRDVPDWEFCYGSPGAAPGEGFDYNACDFIVLAEILERVTGTSFAELVDTRLTRRFGLSSPRIVTDPRDDAEIKGTVGGRVAVPVLKLSNTSAAAAAVGRPVDLLTLTRRFMAGDIVSDPALRDAFGQGDPDLGYVALGVWGFEASLPGCNSPLRLIERQGHINGTKVLTLQSPEQQRALVAFSNREETDWGWIWQGSGLTHDLADAAFCDSG